MPARRLRHRPCLHFQSIFAHKRTSKSAKMTLKQPTGALGLSMRRREFIAALGGGIAAWPLAASGQQQKMPVVGYLSAVARGPFEHFLAGFLEGLKEFGY